MTNKEIVRARINDMRADVRRAYKFSLKYEKNMETAIEVAYAEVKGFIQGFIWSDRVTYDDIDYANRIAAYEYFRLKSVYVKGYSSLDSLDFLKKVLR